MYLIYKEVHNKSYQTILKEDLSGVRGVLFQGAVGALELVPLGELGEGVPGDDVAAHQLHRGVGVRDLLPQDGTREHRVEPEQLILLCRPVCLLVELQTIHRFKQSWRRPLLGHKDTIVRRKL